MSVKQLFRHYKSNILIVNPLLIKFKKFIKRAQELSPVPNTNLLKGVN